MSVMDVGGVVAERVVDEEPTDLDGLDEQLLDQLVGQAKARGVKLAGEGGLLAALTKRLLESALEGEITDDAAVIVAVRRAGGQDRRP
jgi:hypothetical protein